MHYSAAKAEIKGPLAENSGLVKVPSFATRAGQNTGLHASLTDKKSADPIPAIRV